ncbi:tetratricopeptide repeat protein 4-like [Mya arenaria]|uniref:tetratricopeptide repeat protein 4-like n=1 Tax=Mya arenaria TaxID=6604 RepID=UPI0022E112C9|nr:tetratricopeptide repeat protein 4-like [Mya arenaria]
MSESNAEAVGGSKSASSGETKSDDNIDALIDALDKMERPAEIENKTFEEQLESLGSHPAFMKEWDPAVPLSDDMEGLMRLKYEAEDPTAKAEAYKDDGNHEFKKKKYHVAADNYTEGIKCKCPDRLLNAVLYTNRAAAQFHIGNFRSAFNDCVFARKFQPDHLKAIHRGALCCLEMKKYGDCITWCDAALHLEPTNEKFLEIRQKASKLQKGIERDKRKEELREKKVKAKETRLLETIQQRGVKMRGLKVDKEGELKMEGVLGVKQGARVTMDANSVLYWPVMLLYPEYSETDFIQMFCESHRLIDHLSHMFGAETEPPHWDPDRRYKPHTVNMYFEDRDSEKLIKVNKESTLSKVLKHKKYVVYDGTPSFFLTVAGSEFEKIFLEKYKS